MSLVGVGGVEGAGTRGRRAETFGVEGVELLHGTLCHGGTFVPWCLDADSHEIGGIDTLDSIVTV